MTGTIVLNATAREGMALHSIDLDDLERLRLWKNAHRDAFFFKGVITPEGQREWYEGYLARPDDFMFTIRLGGRAIGCIGFRGLGERVDVYNVILGEKDASGKGLMRDALLTMLTEAGRRYPGLPLTLVVLKDNPAVGWYLRSGFAVDSETDTYFTLRYASAESQVSSRGGR